MKMKREEMMTLNVIMDDNMLDENRREEKIM